MRRLGVEAAKHAVVAEKSPAGEGGAARIDSRDPRGVGTRSCFEEAALARRMPRLYLLSVKFFPG